MPAEGCKVYVGGLDERITERDLEDEFAKFGPLNNVWVARRPPGFAFVEYSDPRDAEDAVKDLDGIRGWRVEISRSRGRSGSGRDDRSRGRIPAHNTGFRVQISGIPPNSDWRDLKDFLREGGEITYANVNSDGTGVAEFTSWREMDNAIRKLDDTKFNGGFITIKEDSYQKPSRGRSPPRRRDYDDDDRRGDRYRDRYDDRDRDRYDDRRDRGDRYDDDRRDDDRRDGDRRDDDRRDGDRRDDDRRDDDRRDDDRRDDDRRDDDRRDDDREPEKADEDRRGEGDEGGGD